MKTVMLALLFLQVPSSNKMPDFKRLGIEEQIIYNTSDVIVKAEILNAGGEISSRPFVIMPHAGMRITKDMIELANGKPK